MNRKRQKTIFGTFAKEKTRHYVIFKNPQGLYESYVERYSLRRREVDKNIKKQSLFVEAQTNWKLEENVEDFLILRDGERDFVR